VSAVQLKGILTSLFCLSLYTTRALGAVYPPPSSNAGIIDKQIQRDYEVEVTSPTKDIPIIEEDVPKDTLTIPEGISVQIDAVNFVGNTVFSEKQLKKLISPYIGKKIDGKDLTLICQVIQKHYASKGYILARAFPPVQEVKDNTLTIEIIEGFLGKVEVQGNKHYSTKFIQKHFASQLGRAVNYNDVIRSLLLLNDNMDLSVGAIFKKGDSKGQTDLVVIVKDKRALHLYADINNYGSYITTNDRVGVRLDAGNVIGSGDRLTFVEVLGVPFSDLNFSNAIYSIPVTSNGMRLDFSYLYSHFNVGTLSALDLEGMSNIGGALLSQALKRTRSFSSDIYAGFDYKQIKNEQLGSTYSYDKLRVLSLGGKIDYLDRFVGRTLADFSLYAGIPSFLGGLSAVDPLCSREGAGGRFFIGNASLRRLQKLPMGSLLILSMTGQGTFNKLPIPQQIYIGGVDTVRGFPLASALGDNGYFGTLELRIPPPFLTNKKVPFSKKKKWKDFFQFVGFVDTGGVFLNGAVIGESAPTYMTAAGVGFRIYNLWRFDISFDSGYPLTQQFKSSDSIQYFRVGLRIL
jgi:hemolysin activation/secretion protein